MGSGRSATLQWKATHPRVYRQYKSDLMVEKKKYTKLSWWVRRVGLGGVGDEYEFSKN